MNNFVSCIVAAGGSGSRMKTNKNKLFLDINGKQKEETKVQDLLTLFNTISIECGN